MIFRQILTKKFLCIDKVLLKCYNNTCIFKTMMFSEFFKTENGVTLENPAKRVPKVQGRQPESLRQKDGAFKNSF